MKDKLTFRESPKNIIEHIFNYLFRFIVQYLFIPKNSKSKVRFAVFSSNYIEVLSRSKFLRKNMVTNI